MNQWGRISGVLQVRESGIYPLKDDCTPDEKNISSSSLKTDCYALVTKTDCHALKFIMPSTA